MVIGEQLSGPDLVNWSVDKNDLLRHILILSPRPAFHYRVVNEVH